MTNLPQTPWSQRHNWWTIVIFDPPSLSLSLSVCTTRRQIAVLRVEMHWSAYWVVSETRWGVLKTRRWDIDAVSHEAQRGDRHLLSLLLRWSDSSFLQISWCVVSSVSNSLLCLVASITDLSLNEISLSHTTDVGYRRWMQSVTCHVPIYWPQLSSYPPPPTGHLFEIVHSQCVFKT